MLETNCEIDHVTCKKRSRYFWYNLSSVSSISQFSQFICQSTLRFEALRSVPQFICRYFAFHDVKLGSWHDLKIWNIGRIFIDFFIRSEWKLAARFKIKFMIFRFCEDRFRSPAFADIVTSRTLDDVSPRLSGFGRRPRESGITVNVGFAQLVNVRHIDLFFANGAGSASPSPSKKHT